MTENYFNDTSSISNSQLRSFVNYNKYGGRLLTPDIYKIYHIDKSMQFEVNEAMIIGKIVDLYFEGAKNTVWEIYKPVDRRSKENKEGIVEITRKMEKEALRMIDWGLAFNKFSNFIKLKGTESQVILKKRVEITDTETGEIKRIKLKGLPDFVNKSKKLIVDLKTSGSIDMIVDSLQFKGEPIYTANYIRQLSIYNKLLGGGYNGALALITTKGVKWIDIPNEILEKAWEIIEKDILDLNKFLKNPKSINESIFNEEEITL